MPYKKKTAEPQSILKNRTASSPDKLQPEHAVAIAGLVAAAIRNQNSIYIQPGRYGSVMVKYYIEGDQFAENLVLDDALEELAEQIIETLYTQDDIGWNRRVFAARRAERPPEARNSTKPTQG